MWSCDAWLIDIIQKSDVLIWRPFHLKSMAVYYTSAKKETTCSHFNYARCCYSVYITHMDTLKSVHNKHNNARDKKAYSLIPKSRFR